LHDGHATVAATHMTHEPYLQLSQNHNGRRSENTK